MAKVTTKEMIALIDEDIKFAKMIGDKEFVGYLKEERLRFSTQCILLVMKNMLNYLENSAFFC